MLQVKSRGRLVVSLYSQAAAGVLAAASVAFLGCGGSTSDRAHLAGEVTLEGKEIPADAEAFGTFAAAEAAPGEQPVTAPIAGGKYDSPNTPLARVKVYFDITRKIGPVKRSQRTGAEYQDVVNLVPPKHTTGLEIEVVGDKTDQNFAL